MTTAPAAVTPDREHPSREDLRRLIEDHLRRYGAEAGRVIESFAKAHLMHHTDLRALVLIMAAEHRGDPATPGDLRRELDLTSGAVTGTVDRLVESGHVRRMPDPHDRRQVRLLHDGPGLAVAYEFWGPLGRLGDQVMDRFDDDQLRVIEEFMLGMADAITTHRQAVGAPPPQTDRSS